MINERVMQETNFVCDKCGKSKIVASELEEYQGKYKMISDYTPEGFHLIEELHLLLCNECLVELKKWVKKES